MPGPTPITAPFRLGFLYTVDNLQHRCNFYLNTTASGDPTGKNTVARPGFVGVGLSAAISRFFTRMAPFYDPADTTFNGALLEANTAGGWLFTAFGATTVVPTGGGAYQKAQGLCYSGKDLNNRNLPTYLYEVTSTEILKVSSFTALSAASQAMTDSLFNVSGAADANDPVAWRFSRGLFYSQRWLALVADSNQKLRRIRGIA